MSGRASLISRPILRMTPICSSLFSSEYFSSLPGLPLWAARYVSREAFDNTTINRFVSLSLVGIALCCSATRRGSSGGGRDCVRFLLTPRVESDMMGCGERWVAVCRDSNASGKLQWKRSTFQREQWSAVGDVNEYESVEVYDYDFKRGVLVKGEKSAIACQEPDWLGGSGSYSQSHLANQSISAWTPSLKYGSVFLWGSCITRPVIS